MCCMNEWKIPTYSDDATLSRSFPEILFWSCLLSQFVSQKEKGRTLLLYSLVILEITKKGNFQFSKLPSLPWLISPLKIIYLSALLAFCLSCSVSVCSPSAKHLAGLSFKPLPLLLLQSAATPFLYLNPAELKFCLLHEVLLRCSPHRRLLLLNSCFSSHLLHSSGFSLMMEGGI